MDWIKVPTDNVLYSEYKDSELIVLIKYQALYCQLEVEPSDMQLKRIFNKKQRDFLRSNAEVVQKLVKSQIKVVTSKRNRDKDNYQRKQQLSENSASGQSSESLRTGVAEKRREEKNKENYIKESENGFMNYYPQHGTGEVSGIERYGDKPKDCFSNLADDLKRAIQDFYSYDVAKCRGTLEKFYLFHQTRNSRGNRLFWEKAVKRWVEKNK